MSLKRYKLVIEYDGTPYAGWQRQKNGIPSVQEAIEEAITAFCQQDIRIHVAGRTDAGVHAEGQVAHFDLDYGEGRDLSPHTLTKALNAHLRKHPIVILHTEEVDAEFHARFGAVNKLYTYRVLNRAVPSALLAHKVWHVWGELDLEQMRIAASHLIGRHDFSTFRAAECQAKSPMRTLDRADIGIVPAGDYGQEIRFLFEAKSFLHHQVRNMVGTLMLVGKGKWTADDVRIALEAKDRTKGGPTCPPDGLYLSRIDYCSQTTTYH